MPRCWSRKGDFYLDLLDAGWSVADIAEGYAQPVRLIECAIARSRSAGVI